MKKILFAFMMLAGPVLVGAQTQTTGTLIKKFEGNGLLNLYFYKNTLKMLNQADDKNFDELIRDIQKLRFMMLDKSKSSFSAADYKKLLKDYRSESYEEILTTRMDGKNFDIYVKDKKGSALGTIIMVNDSSSLYILDMIGTVDLKKAPSLFSALDHSTDIGGKIKSFLNQDDEKGKGKKKHEVRIE